MTDKLACENNPGKQPIIFFSATIHQYLKHNQLRLSEEPACMQFRNSG